MRCILTYIVGAWFAAATAAASPQAGYADAVNLVRQAHYDRAIPILRALLANSPADLKARNLLGIALLNSGRREEAVAEFRRAVETDSAFYPAMKNLAIAEVALGRLPDARGHFEQVLRFAPEDAVAHLNLGELDFAAHRYPEALAHYQRTGGLHLKDGQVALRALRSAVNSDNTAAALEIGRALTGSAAALSLLAQVYERSGDTQRAYDALRAATQLEPDNESIYLELLALCVEHHAWDLALEVSAAGIERLPGAFRLRVQRGAVYALKGEVEAAEREFAEAVRLAPGEVLPQVSLALARVQLNRAAEAIAGLRTCRAQHPKDYVVTWILGETLAQNAQETEGLQVLEEAARLGPREAAPKLLLGKLFARRGDLARAAREFEAALKLHPDDASAQYQLATVYRKSGDMKRADELFEKVGSARTLNPQEEANRTLEQVLRGAR